jgi:hypothetical protein
MRGTPLLVVLVAAACGGKSTGPANPTPPPDIPYKDMNADQRAAFMKLTVMPKMKPIFQQFDGKMFAEFNCKTCHGEGAKDGSFDMPNADLPRMPPPEMFMAFSSDPKHSPWV